MKFFLYKLPEGFIVTSDKKVVGTTGFNGETNEIEFFCSHPKYDEWGLEIIAQQNQIDFSALPEEEQKKIGWFDVEKLAVEKSEELYDYDLEGEDWEIAIDRRTGAKYGFKEGFQKAQELLSDRKFTLEEVKLIWKAGQEYWKSSGNSITLEELIERRKELLSKNVWEVEIEMEPYTVGEMANLPIGTVNAKPKFTNGKIKILKIL